mmetsp:Transcript_31221/g.85659  ORF Transcript_31221/g.85659 Transcript_31221/m.85659 type:complete len:303 (-) Transcript_31221:237-1145(-)
MQPKASHGLSLVPPFTGLSSPCAKDSVAPRYLLSCPDSMYCSKCPSAAVSPPTHTNACLRSVGAATGAREKASAMASGPKSAASMFGGGRRLAGRGRASRMGRRFAALWNSPLYHGICSGSVASKPRSSMWCTVSPPQKVSSRAPCPSRTARTSDSDLSSSSQNSRWAKTTDTEKRSQMDVKRSAGVASACTMRRWPWSSRRPARSATASRQKAARRAPQRGTRPTRLCPQSNGNSTGCTCSTALEPACARTKGSWSSSRKSDHLCQTTTIGCLAVPRARATLQLSSASGLQAELQRRAGMQ